MKKIICFLISIFSLSTIFAANKEVKQLKLKNGIPVYYIQNTETEIDAISISVEGSVRYFSPDQSGLESLVFDMMTCGSKKYSYEDIQSYNHKTSTSFYSSSDAVQSSLSVVCIDKYFDSSVDMLIDGFLNPTFEQKEYDKLMNMVRQGVQERLNDPYSLGCWYSSQLLFKNTYLETFSSATMESVNNLTLDLVKSFTPSLYDSSRIKIFVVSKTSSDKIITMLNNSLGKIKPLKTKKNSDSYKFNIVDEPLVITHPSAEGTAFVFRAYNGPDYTQPDFFASVLAQKLYSTVMFNVVRAKYGVCYSVFSDSDAPNSDLLLDIFYRCSDVSKLKAALAESQKIISEGKYIKSTNPDGTYIFVPISEVLEGIKNQYITSSYASQNSTYGLLNRMKSSVYRYGNPTEINKNIEKINAVTEEEIIKAFNKYMLTDKDCYIAVTGPKLESKVYNYLNAN